ncbi:hypothetical protein BJY54_000057 [Streptomyces nodosus]|uniref:Uncharacterized protein n=1 Tax=Streptomyces nodosus TaxID=40318 RepID=A0A5P2VZ70_9ACTN|nr:hypothetical protein [Streptomyces nodosus]QEV37306.1 hypothetical protein CP978_00735 [Streptomyces nodosus]
MRWFGGCAPGGPAAAVPAGARLLWSDPPLWAVGDWDDHRVTAVDGKDGGARLVVFGPCAARHGELVRVLNGGRPGRGGDVWPGSYTVVRSSRAGGDIPLPPVMFSAVLQEGRWPPGPA